jgi:hypothetical protein
MISWYTGFSLLVTIYSKCLMYWASVLDIFILSAMFFGSSFLMQASKNVEKAREVLVEALENAQFSKPLLEVSSLPLSLSLSLSLSLCS